jgi:hypothetical protein
MTMWTWLVLAAVVAAVAALTGIKPKGTRPVSHSRLMGAGRVVMVLMVLIFLYAAMRG